MTLSWSNLGTVTPVLGQWIQFPHAAFGGITFRASYSADFSRPLNSFVWFRGVYFDDQADLSIRLYPSPNPRVFDFPVPEALKANGIIIRHFQVNKVAIGRSFVIPSQDWEMSLEIANF